MTEPNYNPGEMPEPEVVVPFKDAQANSQAHNEPQPDSKTAAAGNAQQAGQQTGQAEALDSNDTASRIASLEAEVATYKDQALRALAEAENTRRRATKEREDAGKYGVASLAKELVGVSDNLCRALEVAGAPTDDKMKQLVAGLDGVQRQLQSAFERAGIRKLEPLDQPFDPNFHRVMLEAEHTGKPAGTVTQVLQAGYLIHDRLLREALVAIAKGPDGQNGGSKASAINEQA